MLQLQELDQFIINWSIEKQITNFEKQKLKFVEEVGEMAGEILTGDTDKLKLEIGDVYVALVILRNLSNEDFFITYPKMYRDKVSGIFLILESIFMSCYDNSFAYLKQLTKDLKLDLTECVNLAYNKISKRNGVTIDGNFFKAKE